MSFSRRRFKPLLRVGIPLITFVFGGFYMLSTFLQTHMEVKDSNVRSISERKFNLEEEHKKLMSKLDIDNFTLSRIPREEENVDKNSKTKSNDNKKK